MRKNYNNWMFESIRELTPANRIKRLSYETVADWVNRSWNAADINLIKWFFKCYGISNKCNEIEDDWIFNYERLEQTKSSNEIEILDDIDNEGVIEDNYERE